MTIKQLNAAIKKLYKYAQTAGIEENEYLKAEFIRLHGADKGFKYMSKKSLLRMMALNSCYRFIPLFKFPLFIEDENEL